MSNTKHTPGPWGQKYITGSSANEVLANGKRIALVLQYDVLQKRVADFRTCEANAKLIAAAPELLASATKAMDFLKSRYNLGFDGEKIADELETVTKKANGGKVPDFL